MDKTKKILVGTAELIKSVVVHCNFMQYIFKIYIIYYINYVAIKS